MKSNPLEQVDFYKVNHAKMYPELTTQIYSNLTPRKSRLVGIDKIVVWGIQYFILEYLIEQWNKNFFQNENSIPKHKRLLDSTLGKDVVSVDNLVELRKLGYLPLEIKALPEGTLCPIGVPCVTITNTVDHAYWLVNYLETIFSCTVWQPITSATIAYQYKKLLTKYAIETTGNADGVQWQGHDFSMRGMSSLESACTSGSGHLLSFTGTDTIPAISFLEEYYGADVEKELVGSSVPATEHSVMCMGEKDSEINTFKRLLNLYPTGILSVVSDTWDLWKVCTEYLPQLKEEILARDGKLVIRPDSGDPVDIICGVVMNEFTNRTWAYEYYEDEIQEELTELCKIEGILYTVTVTQKFNREFDYYQAIFTKIEEPNHPKFKGVIELLWETFGGTINEQGYKVLDPRIGAIYGDSITLERAQQICERLKAKGFASTNIVLGIGSYTYQYNTRDTFGFAVKATYGEVIEATGVTEDGIDYIFNPVGREIFKDPITDDGTKKSKKGLLVVDYDEKGNIVCKDQQTKEQEKTGLLETVFLNGKLTKFQTLAEVRERLAAQ